MAIISEKHAKFTGQPFSVADGVQTVFCDDIDDIRMMFSERPWIYVTEHAADGTIIGEFGICNNPDCPCTGIVQYWRDEG